MTVADGICDAPRCSKPLAATYIWGSVKLEFCQAHQEKLHDMPGNDVCANAMALAGRKKTL